MNTIQLPVMLLVSLLLTLAPYSEIMAGESKRTANYIKAYPDKYSGKKVTLDVAFINRINLNLDESKIVLFRAHTFDVDNRSGGGDIVVIADLKEADKLIKKYGTSIQKSPFPNTRPMSGIMHILQGHGPAYEVYVNISSISDIQSLPLQRMAEHCYPNHKPGPGPGPAPEPNSDHKDHNKDDKEDKKQDPQ